MCVMPDLWTVFVVLSFVLSGQSSAIESPGYINLGCWKDTGDRAIPILEGTDPRLDGQYRERDNAIEKCFQVAVSRNFTVFSVQHGGQCFGSADGLNTYRKHGPSSGCAPDGKGGAWANQVYQVIPGYRSLGCWTDTADRAIATLEGTDPRLDGSYQERANPVEKCYQVALSRGFAVFAVQNGGWCAGSDSGRQNYNKYGPSTACRGDGEGGPLANEVYEIILLGGGCENRSTDDQYVYRWNLTTIRDSSPFTFEVQANNDVYVALSSQNQNLDDMYEIIIGGWNNTRSAIRRSKQGTDQAFNSTPGILSSTESRGFWISWTVTGSIRVGKQGEAHPFLEWTDPQPLQVVYAGYTTGKGSTGQWRFCPSVTGQQKSDPGPSPGGGEGLNGFHIAGIVAGSFVVMTIICGQRRGNNNSRPPPARPPPSPAPTSVSLQDLAADTTSLRSLRISNSLDNVRGDADTVSMIGIASMDNGVDNAGAVYDEPPSYPEESTSVVQVHPPSSDDPPSYANVSSEDPPPPSYEDALNMA